MPEMIKDYSDYGRHLVGTGEGGGGGGDIISDVPYHFLGMAKKSSISIFPFYCHFYWTYPDHIFSLSNPYSDILSMYSIHRMSGNRQHSYNDLQKKFWCWGCMPPPDPPPPPPPPAWLRAYGVRSYSHQIFV